MDNIVMPAMIRPVVFFYIILILPAMPQWVLLLLGFATGIILDSFDHTPGVNAAACTLLAELRDTVLRFLKPGEANDIIKPHLQYMGLRSYVNYLVFMSLVFHFLAGLLGYFTLSGLGYTMVRILLNSAVSVILLLVIDIVFFYRRSKAE
jgi:rod shape-determining protein MreD